MFFLLFVVKILTNEKQQDKITTRQAKLSV